MQPSSSDGTPSPSHTAGTADGPQVVDANTAQSAHGRAPERADQCRRSVGRLAIPSIFTRAERDGILMATPSQSSASIPVGRRRRGPGAPTKSATESVRQLQRCDRHRQVEIQFHRGHHQAATGCRRACRRDDCLRRAGGCPSRPASLRATATSDATAGTTASACIKADRRGGCRSDSRHASKLPPGTDGSLLALVAPTLRVSTKPGQLQTALGYTHRCHCSGASTG